MATRFYVNAPYASGAALFSGAYYVNTAKKNILKTGVFLDFGVSTSITFTMLTLVSRPLETQTIAGTFQGFFLTRRTGISGTMDTLATVAVIAPDGTTRGTLLNSVGSGSPVQTTPTSKDWPVSTAVSSVNAQAGDYLRMDLILSFVGSASQSVGLYIKDGTADADITTTGQTTATLNPWVEFSQNITFLDHVVSYDIPSRDKDLDSVMSSGEFDQKGLQLRSSHSALPRTEFKRKYLNRVYDSVAGKLVTWITFLDPDTTGKAYPGPGVFGSNTTDYITVGIF